MGKAPEISPANFENKYVIVGGSAIGLMDFKSTPFTVYEPYPGMEIHATVLSNFLKKDFMHEPPLWISYFLAVVFALFMSWLFFRIGRIIPTTLVALSGIAGYVAIGLSCFSFSQFLVADRGPGYFNHPGILFFRGNQFRDRRKAPERDEKGSQQIYESPRRRRSIASPRRF